MSISRLTLLSVVVVGSAMLSVGCVPYQKYRDVLRKLDQAKAHNADLITKYNQLMNRYLAKGAGDMEPGERAALLAQIERFKSALDKAGLQIRPNEIPESADVKIEDGGIALGEALLFSPGSAKLKAAAAPVLSQIVDLLQATYSTERFIIEGHTDNQPLNSTAKIWRHNMTLAYNRALAVFEFFLNHGIGEDRMVVYSFSFNKPVHARAVNTVDGRRENRRVVVRRSGEQVTRVSTASA